MGKKGKGKKGKVVIPTEEIEHWGNVATYGWGSLPVPPPIEEEGKDPEPRPAVEPFIGIWDRPVAALPYGEYFVDVRKEVLLSLTSFSTSFSPSMTDDFLDEYMGLNPDKLTNLEIRGGIGVTRFFLAPVLGVGPTLPNLTTLDIGCCPNLDFVFIESDSLVTLTIHRNTVMKRCLLKCPNLEEIVDGFSDCLALEELSVWSEKLQYVDVSCCPAIKAVNVYCPKLLRPVALPEGGVNRPTDNMWYDVDIMRPNARLNQCIQGEIRARVFEKVEAEYRAHVQATRGWMGRELGAMGKAAAEAEAAAEEVDAIEAAARLAEEAKAAEEASAAEEAKPAPEAHADVAKDSVDPAAAQGTDEPGQGEAPAGEPVPDAPVQGEPLPQAAEVGA